MRKQTLLQLLEASANKKFLFLGRESLFTQEEIVRFLKKYHITLTRYLEEDVVGVVEHHALNPVEEDISCEAYDKGLPLFKLFVFEKLLSESIHDDELLMGVKLSNDQERIFRLLGNEHISNVLFVKLLEMYQWYEEEEDNRQDRDVIIYTLRRYIEVKPNEEDLLYSPLTLKRLSSEATDPRLLEVLIKFPNITFLQKGKQKITLRESIASNPHIDEAVIGRLMQLRDAGVDSYLAANTVTPLNILQRYAQRDEEQINYSLASNHHIDEVLFSTLLNKSDTVIQMLLWYQPITMQRYRQLQEVVNNKKLFASLGENITIDVDVLEKLVETSHEELLMNLAKNESLEGKFLEYIFNRAIPKTYPHLAINPSTPLAVLEKLYRNYHQQIDILTGLSYNPSTPVEILKALYQRDVFEITKGIASNASVPLEILNILKIDTRLRNELTVNKTFVASITQKLGL
ncbi:Leucine rich repeat variant [hydrothermal vent metagenome]|uniref:Leucine rich repeat variant n=1 Tax=hydrothermal vent metagenome TaxID=652676 RepID=A0A1W1CEV7_9ZZZZ